MQRIHIGYDCGRIADREIAIDQGRDLAEGGRTLERLAALAEPGRPHLDLDPLFRCEDNDLAHKGRRPRAIDDHAPTPAFLVVERRSCQTSRILQLFTSVLPGPDRAIH